MVLYRIFSSLEDWAPEILRVSKSSIVKQNHLMRMTKCISNNFLLISISFSASHSGERKGINRKISSILKSIVLFFFKKKVTTVSVIVFCSMDDNQDIKISKFLILTDGCHSKVMQVNDSLRG